MPNETKQIRIHNELHALEQLVPGSLERIEKAATLGRIVGNYYTSCALFHAVQNSDYEGTPEHLSQEVSKKVYGKPRACLEMEKLLLDVWAGETPAEGCEALQELVGIMQEVRNS